MSATTASGRISEEVMSWAGVEAGPGDRGEYSFKVGKREIGHLHGDHSAHLFFPKERWRQLHGEGRIEHHPVFPDREGPAARRIESDEDVADVIELLRLSYRDAVARAEAAAAARAAQEESSSRSS